jgi:hypothetical protein
MEEILKTTLLEYEKSAFIIDLVKHHSGKQYVRILQTIREEESEHARAIKINPTLLSDIVRVLNSYRELIPGLKNTEQPKHNETTRSVRLKSLTESEKTAIQNRYLKGVSISDLTIQFDCKAELIEQILNNNGIVIMDNSLTKSSNYKKFRRRKR